VSREVEEQIEALVAQWWPLSAEQLDKLAAIFAACPPAPK